MKFKLVLVLMPVFLWTQQISANTQNENYVTTVNTLMNYYFPQQKKLNDKRKAVYKLGDFNGDGLEDIAVLFLPVSKPKESPQHKVSQPWIYPGKPLSHTYSRSLTIFQRSNEKWISDKTRIFTFLDTSGVLETPSFELRVSKKTHEDYKHHNEMLAIKTSKDILVLPTEAGIDTYIYWNNNSYQFMAPEEMP